MLAMPNKAARSKRVASGLGVALIGVALNRSEVFVFEFTFIESPSCVAAGRVWQELQKNRDTFKSYLLWIVFRLEENHDRLCTRGLLSCKPAKNSLNFKLSWTNPS